MTLQPLVRDRADAKIGGVCGALARSSGLDPLLVRIGFALLAVVTGGVAILGYFVLWGLTPSRETGVEPLRQWLPFTRTWSPTALVIVVLAASLTLGGVFTGSGPGPLVLLLIVWLLLRNGSRRRTPPPQPVFEPRTPFERLARAWEQRLANVDAGRPVDWAPEYDDPDPHGLYSAPSDVVGSSVHRRHGRRSWFGVLVGVGAVWFACGALGSLGVTVPPLAWASASLAVLALTLVWSARPSRAALGRPPLLATVTVLTGLLTAGLLVTTVVGGASPQRLMISNSTPSPIAVGAAELAIGEHLLDYTTTPVLADSEVEYSMMLGEVTVVVPATGNVVVNTWVDAGEIATPGSSAEGFNIHDSWRRTEVPDAPTLTINVRLSAGDVRVVEP